MKQKLKNSLRSLRRSNFRAARRRRIAAPALLVLVLLFIAALAGCEVERRKSDAELGLTPTQAAGRHIYDRQCGACHEAYSSRPLKGPSLQGLFKHPYMKNGMPANDERVRDIIVYGRSKMPAFGRALNQQQIDQMMEYLHTL